MFLQTSGQQRDDTIVPGCRWSLSSGCVSDVFLARATGAGGLRGRLAARRRCQQARRRGCTRASLVASRRVRRLPPIHWHGHRMRLAHRATPMSTMTETKRFGDPRATKLARVHPRLRACWHRRRAARWPRSPPDQRRARETHQRQPGTNIVSLLAARLQEHDRRSSAGFAVGGGDMRRHPPCRGPCRGPP